MAQSVWMKLIPWIFFFNVTLYEPTRLSKKIYYHLPFYIKLIYLLKLDRSEMRKRQKILRNPSHYILKIRMLSDYRL